MGVTTNTTKLRASIIPLRTIGIDTHTYGFESNIYPIDYDGFAVPSNEMQLNVAKDRGYRYYSYVKDVENIDILGLLKEQTAKLTSKISIENCYFILSKINLMQLDNVLLPSDFDVANETNFATVHVLNDINFQYQSMEESDAFYLKYSGYIQDETRDGKVRITFTSGVTATSYDVYIKPVIIPSREVKYWVEYRDYNNNPQGYYTTKTEPSYTITADLVAGGTYTLLADDLNFLETFKSSITTIVNLKSSAKIFEEKNRLKKQKVTFTFKTPLNDEAAGTDFSSLQQFMTRYGFERFGVAIYEDGATITKVLNAFDPYDVATDVLGLNDTATLTYAICNYISHSLEDNTVTWSGYYYRLPRRPELFNLVKINNKSRDSTCVLGAGNENFNVLYASTTIARDTTNNEDDVVFLAGAAKRVDGIYSWDRILEQVSGPPNPSSKNVYIYYEFEIKNLAKTGTAVAEIEVFLKGYNPVAYFESDYISINKNGVYRFTKMIEYVSGNDFFVDLRISPNVTVPAASTITFSITNISYGECV